MQNTRGEGSIAHGSFLSSFRRSNWVGACADRQLWDERGGDDRAECLRGLHGWNGDTSDSVVVVTVNNAEDIFLGGAWHVMAVLLLDGLVIDKLATCRG